STVTFFFSGVGFAAGFAAAAERSCVRADGRAEAAAARGASVETSDSAEVSATASASSFSTATWSGSGWVTSGAGCSTAGTGWASTAAGALLPENSAKKPTAAAIRITPATPATTNIVLEPRGCSKEGSYSSSSNEALAGSGEGDAAGNGSAYFAVASPPSGSSIKIESKSAVEAA